MSDRLINHNPDLKRLRDEGYEIEIRHGHLIVRNVPYVNSKKEVLRGVFIVPLGNMSGDSVGKPQDHTIYFTGEIPCDKDGTALSGLINSTQNKTLAEGVFGGHYCSAKPPSGNYDNYYEKVVTYVGIVSHPAEAIDNTCSAKTNQVVESVDPETVFRYLDANSSRGGFEAISSKLKNLKIAIIGLGGTGSYVLDLVAKTPVREIHIFDGDVFYSHNAFRSPGAASLDTLRTRPTKVGYLSTLYSQVHKYIVPHEFYVTPENLDTIAGMDFVFVCIDSGEIKRVIVNRLMSTGIRFVDTGVGVDNIDGLLAGTIRVTTVTPQKNDHVGTRISFSETKDDAYDQNIQIAELNALTAATAVIKWKKLFGFYHDLGKEYNTAYDTDSNEMTNGENFNT